MATKEQKEQLVETLKFTPCDYRIEITGRGGEYVIGKVSREIYDYFQENDIDISDYANACDYEYEHVPEDMRPFTPGQWFECDEEFHEYGALSGAAEVTVYDENENVVFTCDLDYEKLDDAGVKSSYVGEHYASEIESPVVFFGSTYEKGLMFQSTVHLTSPFEPKKLGIYFEEVECDAICTSVEYNEEGLDNDGPDTSGKGSNFVFIDNED